MNSNQMVRSKGSNLSATTEGQKNSSNNANTSNNPRENKSLESKDSLYSNAHDCSGGVCQTNWKPVAQIA